MAFRKKKHFKEQKKLYQIKTEEHYIHSTEGFISNKRNKMSKMVAAEAIRNVSANLAQNAKDTLGVNFLNDPCMLNNEDCIAIYQASYK